MKKTKMNEIKKSVEDATTKKKKPRILELPIAEIPKETCELFVCGQNDLGQCGLGESEMERKKPAINAAVKDIVDISAGGIHSLCLTKEGYVYSFGCNDEGALGRDTKDEGSEYVPKKVDLSGKCVKITAGDSHSAFLMEDGRVFGCGSFRDSHGSMGLTLSGKNFFPVELLPGIKTCDIASGSDHLLMLSCSGKVYSMGCGEQGQLGRVSLRTATGESRRGKTDLLTPSCVSIQKGKIIKSIWATNFCSFVQEMNNSKIYGFGLNNWSQLGIKSTKLPIIRPIITNIENVKSITGGQHHTLILKTDKKCYAIGRCTYGCLGIGEKKEEIFEEFQEITTLSDKNVVSIACGDSQSFAVTSNGKLYSWGMGTSLQLGTGSEEDAFEPVLVLSKSTQDKKFIKVSSGAQHTLFLAKNESNFEEVKNEEILSNELCNGIESTDNLDKNQHVSDKENNVSESNQRPEDNNNKKRKRGINSVESNKNYEGNNDPDNVDVQQTAPKRGRKKKN